MIVGVPVQAPGSAVSVVPSRVSGETIDGPAVAIGDCATTADVRPETTVALPPAFVAVTATRSVAPTSAGVAV